MVISHNLLDLPPSPADTVCCGPHVFTLFRETWHCFSFAFVLWISSSGKAFFFAFTQGISSDKQLSCQNTLTLLISMAVAGWIHVTAKLKECSCFINSQGRLPMPCKRNRIFIEMSHLHRIGPQIRRVFCVKIFMWKHVLPLCLTSLIWVPKPIEWESHLLSLARKRKKKKTCWVKQSQKNIQ